MKSRDLFQPVSVVPLKDARLTIRRCRVVSNICGGLGVAVLQMGRSFGLRHKHAGPEDLMLASLRPNNRSQHSGRRNNCLQFSNYTAQAANVSILAAVANWEELWDLWIETERKTNHITTSPPRLTSFLLLLLAGVLSERPWYVPCNLRAFRTSDVDDVWWGYHVLTFASSLLPTAPHSSG